MGDMLGASRACIVNFVVRTVKKMVPAYTLPGAVRFKQMLGRRPRT
jgi:long-chain acyl-CoA synthetase